MTAPKRRTISQRSELIYDAHQFGIMVDTREIFIHPFMDSEPENAEVDFRMSNCFIKNLQLLNSINNDKILIHINTCGGYWSYGMAMFDAIKSNPSEIIILSYGEARSMSSIIPQAAKWRVLMPNCDFMIHDGSLGLDEHTTSKGAKSIIDWNEYQCEVMLNIYAEKCQGGQFFQGYTDKKRKEFIKDKMGEKQDWYMTSREAIQYGFADAVLGDDGFEDIETLLSDDEE